MSAPVLVIGTRSVHVTRFVGGLCSAGQSVVLVTDTAEPLVNSSLLLAQLKGDFSVMAWRTPACIRRFARQWQPRLAYVHQANSVGWHAGRGCAGLGFPIVLTLWGSDVLVTPHLSRLHRWMVRDALRAAAFWTADSAHVLAEAEKVAEVSRPAAHIVIGVDAWPADLSRLWSQKMDRFLTCRLHKPLYRIDSVIQAFAALAPRHPTWCLEVAAAGPETASLQSLAGRLGVADRVQFTGYLDAAAMARSNQRARVYVSFPSSDGTSVSLLEAMAQGCLPVVSDLPANREWVVDRLNGLVVRHPTELAAAMERAIDLSNENRWQKEAAPANLRLVREKATFTDNIRQFLALGEGLAP